MPRGKYARKNKRNETALTTQLMRINLRMDDHIYNGKPIAASEAAQFLQQIATLKLQCLPTNIRGLQVIEKLTRLLRNILTEEDCGHVSSSFNKSFQLTNEFVGSASPVYSLPDEDKNEDIYEQNNLDISTPCISDNDETIHKQNDNARRQNNSATEFARSAFPVYDLTDKNNLEDIHGQNFDMDNLNTTRNPRGDITHKEMYISRVHALEKQGCITITQAGNTYSRNNCEVIDVTNDSETDEAGEILAVSKEQSISIEHVNYGMSNMMIHDNNGNQMKPVYDNCSQSILDNYAQENENAANGKDKVIDKESYQEKYAKTHVVNKVNNYFQKQAPLEVIHTQDIFVHSKLTDCKSSKVDLNANNSSIKHRTIPEEKNKEIGNDKVKPKKRKPKKNLKLIENNAAHKCQQNVSEKTSTNKNYNKENRTKTVRRSKKLKKVDVIYNENVENDLSWVEDLRYVREVSPSECDPALTVLQDNFWHNFELPGTWSDLDFEV